MLRGMASLVYQEIFSHTLNAWFIERKEYKCYGYGYGYDLEAEEDDGINIALASQSYFWIGGIEFELPALSSPRFAGHHSPSLDFCVQQHCIIQSIDKNESSLCCCCCCCCLVLVALVVVPQLHHISQHNQWVVVVSPASPLHFALVGALTAVAAETWQQPDIWLIHIHTANHSQSLTL